jgi:hypothetical protein
LEVDPVTLLRALRSWSTAALLALWVALLPALLFACPACAGRNDGNSLRTYAVLATMICLPFVVAGVVVQLIRRIESDSSR